jgi:acetyl esterase/lipase
MVPAGVTQRRRVFRAAMAIAVAAATLILLPTIPAQASVTVTRNVVYKHAPGVNVKLDVYMPPGRGPFPSVVVVHGGSWWNGARSEFVDTGTKLAQEGFVVYAVDFRMPCRPTQLKPQSADPKLCHYPFPTPTEDIGDAVAWVRIHGAKYKGRTDKVGIVGSSTGGDLAMHVGVTGPRLPSHPDVIVSWSGVGDLTIVRTEDTHRRNYVGCAYAACPGRWANASPDRHVDPLDAPLYLSGSTQDPNDPLRDQQETVATWRAAGLPVQHRLINGTCHARSCFRENPIIWRESVSWLHHFLDEPL